MTSPPYWGLRDYGNPAQIGLERTPEEYVASLVAVFREVWRVLKDDGTLWLNLGDSYASDTKGSGGPSVKQLSNAGSRYETSQRLHHGLKPKDLVGIPWMVAKALQAPYYTGRIKSKTDRAWLAAFIDSEGTITYVERDRGEDHTPTHDVRVFATNCDRGPMDEFAAMTAGHVYQHESGERQNRYGERACYRWQMGTHDGALLLREIYPFLRIKRKQAALVWTLYTTLRHKNGHARTPADVIEKRREIAMMVRALNAGESVDLPSWIEEPPRCHEPGWYLRSDIIWAKPNPMPESVTDRPTKSHEYIFLLSKAERYYFDADAISEPATYAGKIVTLGEKSLSRGQANGACVAPSGNGTAESVTVAATRNSRTVWPIATQPYSGAHFATFPEEIPKRCILAGSKPGDVILDPFSGSGTTLKVATDLGRNGIGLDISRGYHALAKRRTITTIGLAL